MGVSAGFELILAKKGHCTAKRKDVGVCMFESAGRRFGGCTEHEECGLVSNAHWEDVAHMPLGCLLKIAFEEAEAARE